jgi:hypothetical protein
MPLKPDVLAVIFGNNRVAVSIKFLGGIIMEKIREMIDNVAAECERQGIPFLAAFGLDKISACEFAPENTPELLKKTRTVLFNSTTRARRQLEIEG